MRRIPAFRNLPLFWKLLVPFFTLMVIVGPSGLPDRPGPLLPARTTMNENLFQASFEARALLHERELFLWSRRTWRRTWRG